MLYSMGDTKLTGELRVPRHHCTVPPEGRLPRPIRGQKTAPVHVKKSRDFSEHPQSAGLERHITTNQFDIK